jgi:hypothetical protein
MTRRFQYEGEEWEVQDLDIITGAGTVSEPQLLDQRVEFSCVSDSTKEPIFANIPKRNLDKISDAELSSALQQAPEKGKD